MTTNTIEKLINNTDLLTNDDLPQTIADWEALADALSEIYRSAKTSTNPAMAAAIQKWIDMKKFVELHKNDPFPVFPGFEEAGEEIDSSENDAPLTAEQTHLSVFQSIYGGIGSLEIFIKNAEF